MSSYKHGLWGTPEYIAWNNMMARCYNPKHSQYKDYGGRSIWVYWEWYDSPEHYVNYVREVLGPKPSKSHTVDRIDNDEGYVPGNLRWASKKQQQNNRREHHNALLVTHKGKTLNLTQWSQQTGIKYKALYWRFKNGWKPSEILGAV